MPSFRSSPDMMAKDTGYETVQFEDHSDDRSSTEVEESLIGDEKPCRNCYAAKALERTRPERQGGRWRQRLGALSGVVNTLLLLANLGLLVRQMTREPRVNMWDFGGDLTGVGPRFSQQIKVFEPDYDGKYAPNDTSLFFTNETLHNWNELMPIGMGFQWVNDTHKYHDLPTPIIWPGKTVFTTSITHQLHCLFAVVQTYSGLKSEHELPEDHHWHMIHCFAYLRQTIMCSADTALEGLETTFPDHNGGSDGWDSKHVCKDYGEVTRYLESVRAYDDREIF
ncbi:hypothetical protein EV126DRAFT_429404 [Verticillium dahliae]|uniref:Uncharacterized protein n=2 Tax=Verticillium dahliae TaxID=27337 RepID=A0A2J8DEL9_VERDA|nr:hypothetical protein EV126DRAFT_429404 [Verticillium dahliae]PNH47714.1 hypothetical protein VD0003_g8762 [Verticillium dahliae]RXG44450.1 hypothetical protein VDGE_05055 [Verticillium dahliae]